MYAGSQDSNTNPSTQTFLISTKSPYAVRAFESTAPPVINPLILPYNSSHALLLGGEPTNQKLYTFGPDEGWQQLNITLQSALKDSSLQQATILNGGDGSKILEIYDLSVTPNQITTVLLQNATTVSKSNKPRSYVASQHHPAKRRKRDISLTDRPAYNGTLAPQHSRVGYSLAADSSNGLVVATGGNSQEPLAMFNQTSNQWIDPNKFFGDEPSPTASSSSASSEPSASSTTTMAPAASSSAAAADAHVRNKSLTILGGVLGGVFGAALLLVAILLLLRFCRRRKEKKQKQRRSEYALDDKNEPMDFTDIGADFMKEAGGSMTVLPTAHQYAGHQRMESDRAVDPRTIDRGMTASSESKRGLLHQKNNSAGSGKSFWSRGSKSPENTRSPPQISAPILGPPLAKPSFLTPNDPRTEPRTDAGWSRYFTNNNSREALPMKVGSVPAHGQQHLPDTRPQTYLSDSQAQSDYTSSRVPSSHPHESAEVEPLSFRTSHAPPQISDRGITSPNASRPGLGLAITHGPSPERERDIEPATPSTLVSGMSDEDDGFHHQMSHISHGTDSEGHDSWGPLGNGIDRESTWTDVHPSSNVHNSRIYPHPGERVEIPNFPMPNSARNSAAPSPKVRSPIVEQPDPFNKGMRNVLSKDLVRSNSGRQQATPDVRTGTQRILPGYGQSEARSLPRPKEQMGARGRGGSQTEDMSWLNLGTSAEQSNDLYFPGR